MCQTPTITCPHYPACSGCTRIGVPYPEQLAAKLEAVRGVLAQHELGGFELGQLTKIHASPNVSRYRNRVKLVPRLCAPSDAAEASPTGGSTQAKEAGRIALGLYPRRHPRGRGHSRLSGSTRSS